MKAKWFIVGVIISAASIAHGERPDYFTREPSSVGSRTSSVTTPPNRNFPRVCPTWGCGGPPPVRTFPISSGFGPKYPIVHPVEPNTDLGDVVPGRQFIPEYNRPASTAPAPVFAAQPSDSSSSSVPAAPPSLAPYGAPGISR